MSLRTYWGLAPQSAKEREVADAGMATELRGTLEAKRHKSYAVVDEVNTVKFDRGEMAGFKKEGRVWKSLTCECYSDENGEFHPCGADCCCVNQN